jgi:hypothetical protein
MIAGAGLTLLVGASHTLGGLFGDPPTADPGMAELFATMNEFHPGGNMGSELSMLDVLKALGLSFGVLVTVPSLQCLIAALRRGNEEALLRNLAFWNAVWSFSISATMAVFGVPPGIPLFALIGVLYSLALVPKREAARSS